MSIDKLLHKALSKVQTKTLGLNPTITYRLANILLFALGICALTAAAKVNIPVKPVPINLQTVVVMLIGLYYSPKMAFATVCSYLALGFGFGMPVFTGVVTGVAKLVGPAAGYLVGFPIATYYIAKLNYNSENSNNVYYVAVSLAVGTCVIYGLGVLWLAYLLSSMQQAFVLGVVPFILPGILKISLLSLAVKYIKN
jgi:biotin transport system substrate-specific component